MKVDRAQIVDEALKLLNEVGIDALSTRLLADRLNVRQPALYWHFKSKRALIEAMAEEIMARGHTHDWPVVPDNWRDRTGRATTRASKKLVGGQVPGVSPQRLCL